MKPALMTRSGRYVATCRGQPSIPVGSGGIVRAASTKVGMPVRAARSRP